MDNKIKIALLTGSRSDFALVRPLIDECSVNPQVDYDLIVTGFHLKSKGGKIVDHLIGRLI